MMPGWKFVIQSVKNFDNAKSIIEKIIRGRALNRIAERLERRAEIISLYLNYSKEHFDWYTIYLYCEYKSKGRTERAERGIEKLIHEEVERIRSEFFEV